MKSILLTVFLSSPVFAQSPIDYVKNAIETGESWAGQHVRACIKDECVEVDRSQERRFDPGAAVYEGGNPNGGADANTVIEALQAAGGMFRGGAKGKVKVVVESGEGATHKKVEVEVEIEVYKK